MKDFLNKIRMPEKNISTKNKIINTSLVAIFGVALGIFSKWLDNLAIDNTIWWHNVIEKLDLGNFFSGISIWLLLALIIAAYSKTPIRAGINVFLFFTGMTVSYHIYTILFSGFNPSGYMMIWYLITFFSPILAVICWYSRGNSKISLFIRLLILFTLLWTCFSIGLWYIYIKSILDMFVFMIGFIVLFVPANKK